MAFDWCDGSLVKELARSSFQLHKDLSVQFSDCDYRNVHTLSVSLQEGNIHLLLLFNFYLYIDFIIMFIDLGKTKSKKKTSVSPPSWITGPVTSCSEIGNTSTTAQVP